MKILVTGGAGFIGSHLCARLLNEGHEVICLDNFFTGQKKNIEPLLKNPHFSVVEHDIVEPITIDAEQVYNLACPASPIHYQFNPIRTIKTSTIGMINMLGLAKRCGARILQASTSEIYGDPLVHPQPESYWGNVNTIGPRSCYDEGKRVAETLCFDYHRSNNVDIRVIRIFNTYGPHMHPQDGRVVSQFIIQALQNQPLTVNGDGSHTRSFCYVDDLVEGMLRMMDQDNHTGPINLGNPHEITVSELAKRILTMTNSTSQITYTPLPEDDPKKRQPDITLAKKILDWQPTVGLEAGLIKTIDYFRSLTP
ncbi:MAG: SDR family oxidoreductase [Candidatus Andersenbacteria bacterium]|nr:SDR family oxidoreductase [Candidatus Andersenbacteria bacterium]